MQKVQEEAETTLGMLAFDAFPRFLKSKYCNAVMDDLKKSSNPNEVSKGQATFCRLLCVSKSLPEVSHGIVDTTARLGCSVRSDVVLHRLLSVWYVNRDTPVERCVLFEHSSCERSYCTFSSTYRELYLIVLLQKPHGALSLK